MPAEKNKITTRQLFVIFILVVLSPTIRLFPQVCSELGGIAGWTAPVFSAAAFAVLYQILHVFFKNSSMTNLSDVFDLTLGKLIGKILMVIFLVWAILLYFLYIRYYAERLLSSIFPNTNIRFFILTMLFVVYLASRGKIESFARFCEFSFLLFTVLFIVFYLLLIPTTKAANLLPLTYYDIWPALKSTYPVLGIWGYITFLFFLGDHVIKKEEIIVQGKKTMIFLAVMTMALMITVVGSLGHNVAERMPLPFFNAIKIITVTPEFNRFEAIVLSIWVISDFVVITSFLLIIMNITKKLFAVSEVKFFASPLILLGYAGSLFLAIDRFELEKFSAYIGLSFNIFVCFVIPIIVFIIGKIRRKM